MTQKKNNIAFSVRLPREMVAYLDRYIEAKKIRSRSAMVELVLEEFMDKIQKEKLEELERKIGS